MKLTEQQLLELKCRLEKYITEREAMAAQNKIMEQVKQPLPYNYDNFFQVVKKIEELENHICWLGEK